MNAVAMHTDMSAAFAVMSAWTAMLDRACECVMALGYGPDECLIEHCCSSPDNGDRRLLRVLGEPCFEVTTTRSEWVDYKCTVTHTPRLIAWPPYRPMTAPQLRAPSVGGET
jgi:hypothetical protein